MFPAKASAVLPDASSGGLAQPPPAGARKDHFHNTGKAIQGGRRIRLLLVDDHPIVRKGISSCLARHEHLVIVGEAADGLEAVAKAKELLPDIVLLDIDMPNMSGLAVTEVLRKDLPQVKVLILSMHQRAEYLLRILQSGARGYVLKEASPEELVKAIERSMPAKPSSARRSPVWPSTSSSRETGMGRTWRSLPTGSGKC